MGSLLVVDDTAFKLAVARVCYDVNMKLERERERERESSPETGITVRSYSD